MFKNMINRLIEEWDYLVREWYKYMDTTVPENVDRQLFTHLKYSNKNRIKQITKKYPEIDTGLLEKHALMEYLKKTDEEIRNDMNLYYGGIKYEINKGNGKRS